MLCLGWDMGMEEYLTEDRKGNELMIEMNQEVIATKLLYLNIIKN